MIVWRYMGIFCCSFYDRDAPIYTMSRFLPPSKVQDSEVNNSILGDGCVIRAGSKINHSVIGLRALINENCTVDDALIMGADYYETLEECALVPGCLPMGLGACSPDVLHATKLLSEEDRYPDIKTKRPPEIRGRAGLQVNNLQYLH